MEVPCDQFMQEAPKEKASQEEVERLRATVKRLECKMADLKVCGNRFIVYVCPNSLLDEYYCDRLDSFELETFGRMDSYC